MEHRTERAKRNQKKAKGKNQQLRIVKNGAYCKRHKQMDVKTSLEAEYRRKPWEHIRMAKQARINKNGKEESKRTGNGYKEHKNGKL